MSPTQQEVLFKKYPNIFKDRCLTIQQSCMPWGLDIGQGWYGIIDALCASIQNPYSASCSTAEDGSDEGWSYEFPQVVADQVKEKFGSLRFYYHLDPDADFLEKAKRFPKTAQTIYARCSAYVDGAVGLAETLSVRTCEETGAPGEMYQRGGWYVTASPEIAAKGGYTKPEAR